MPSSLPVLTVPFVPRLMLPGGMPLTATQLLLSLLLAAPAVPGKNVLISEKEICLTLHVNAAGSIWGTTYGM